MITSWPAVRVIHDPRPHQVVECPVASCLEVQFPPGLTSRWRIVESPGHLVPISEGDHTFTFVVFAGNRELRPLRLVRYRPDRDVEERTLHVLPHTPLSA